MLLCCIVFMGRHSASYAVRPHTPVILATDAYNHGIEVTLNTSRTVQIAAEKATIPQEISQEASSHSLSNKCSQTEIKKFFLILAVQKFHREHHLTLKMDYKSPLPSLRRRKEYQFMLPTTLKIGRKMLNNNFYIESVNKKRIRTCACAIPSHRVIAVEARRLCERCRWRRCHCWVHGKLQQTSRLLQSH